MKPLIIVNPAAGGGKAGKRWPKCLTALQEVLGAYDTEFTTTRRGAIELAAEAAAQDRDLVIAAGGDGTVHEVLNGLCMAKDKPPVLGLLPLGSGNDFARSFGIAALPQAIAALRLARTRNVDVGHITFEGQDGARQSRVFANEASIGFVSEVVAAAKSSRMKRLIGGRLSYPWCALRVLRRFRGNHLVLESDGTKTEMPDMLSIAIANGGYFGGGMNIAPHAGQDDGVLDVIAIARKPKVKPRDLLLLYKGKHLSHPAVSFRQLRHMAISSSDGADVHCEADGEYLGRAPCTISTLPRHIRLMA